MKNIHSFKSRTGAPGSAVLPGAPPYFFNIHHCFCSLRALARQGHLTYLKKKKLQIPHSLSSTSLPLEEPKKKTYKKKTKNNNSGTLGQRFVFSLKNHKNKKQ